MIIVKVLDHNFKRLQHILSQVLLAHVGQQESAAVGLLVVGGKVLNEGVHAPLSSAVDLGGSELAGQHAIFGVVLEVTSREGSAVQVHGRAIPAIVLGVGKLLSHGRANLLCQLLVPGLCHHHLGGELGAHSVSHIVG